MGLARLRVAQAFHRSEPRLGRLEVRRFVFPDPEQPKTLVGATSAEGSRDSVPRGWVRGWGYLELFRGSLLRWSGENREMVSNRGRGLPDFLWLSCVTGAANHLAVPPRLSKYEYLVFL